MKKLKCLFLTLFLVAITFVPSVVFAEVKEVKNESEFIKAIADGGDIKIVEDFTVNGRHDVKKDLTIDLNNHEISFSYKSRLEIKGAKVVIDGTGKMKEIDPYTAPIAIVGSQNKEDELYSTLTVKENVTLEGFYGTFITVNTDSKKVSYDYGIKVDIYGTLIGKKDDTERGAAFYVNGSNKIKENCPIVTIHSSAKLLGDGEGLYLAGYADVTIEKGATVTGGTGIEARAGKLTINGAIITGTDEELVSKANSNGATTFGAGIAMVQHVSKVDVNILINDATVKANTALFVEDVEKNGSKSLEGSSLIIRDGVYSGKLKIDKSYLVEMTRGRFDEDVTTLIPSTYDVVRNDDTETFDIISIYTIDQDELLESVKYYTNDKEVISAAEGEKIKVIATPKKGYYIKSITRITEDDEALVENSEFIMPSEATELIFDIVKIEDEKGNLILIPTPLAVDGKIDKDVLKELSESKLDNSKSGLLDAVDKSKLNITDNNIVTLSIETSLKSYDKDSKTFVYDIKPYYIIDSGEKKELPNEAIKKSVSIKVPVLKEITEKYAKVIHKNGDKIIDEKTYEIKTDGNEKYIVIETSSFSTFEISFTNDDGNKNVIVPDNTENNTENNTTENKPETKDAKTEVNENKIESPKTADNVLLYTLASVISVTGIVILTCISKKKKILR